MVLHFHVCWPHISACLLRELLEKAAYANNMCKQKCRQNITQYKISVVRFYLNINMHCKRCLFLKLFIRCWNVKRDADIIIFVLNSDVWYAKKEQ